MKKHGFTLMELLITIAVILILAGMLVPRLDMGFGRQKFEADLNKLVSNIALAQQYAMGQKDGHRYYGISFYTGGYRIIPYDDPKIPLAPVFAPSSVNTNGDIPFSEGISVSGGKNIVFDSRGSLLSNNDIQISMNSKNRITITHLTGHIRTD